MTVHGDLAEAETMKPGREPFSKEQRTSLGRAALMESGEEVGHDLEKGNE